MPRDPEPPFEQSIANGRVSAASELTEKQVDFDLGLSEITVKTYRGAVMQKMAARSFADLVRMADALGSAPPNSPPHTKVGAPPDFVWH